MKTIGDLLNFYKVEMGKRYKITQTSLKLPESSIFTVEKMREYYGGLGLKFEGSSKTYAMHMLNECDYEEVKSPILDDIEREYLQHYVMDNPAFKGKVLEIVKFAEEDKRGFLVIYILPDGDAQVLPYFPLDAMYKGMELEKDYTPQELGLKR